MATTIRPGRGCPTTIATAAGTTATASNWASFNQGLLAAGEAGLGVRLRRVRRRGARSGGVDAQRYPEAWLPADAGRREARWTPDKIPTRRPASFHYLWFETQHTLADWVARSQAHQAWATRLMTEAFRRDRRMNSFAIHLFIDAFPAGWMKAIMDCERRPKPAYFAYRDASTPLAVDLRGDRTASLPASRSTRGVGVQRSGRRARGRQHSLSTGT